MSDPTIEELQAWAEEDVELLDGTIKKVAECNLLELKEAMELKRLRLETQKAAISELKETIEQEMQGHEIDEEMIEDATHFRTFISLGLVHKESQASGKPIPRAALDAAIGFVAALHPLEMPAKVSEDGDGCIVLGWDFCDLPTDSNLRWGIGPEFYFDGEGISSLSDTVTNEEAIEQVRSFHKETMEKIREWREHHGK